MNGIFDFQKLLFSLYGAHDRKSADFQLWGKRERDRLFTKLEHAHALDGKLEVDQNIVQHDGTLSFGYDGRRMVIATDIGHVRSFYPAHVNVTIDQDPRDSYIFIEGPPQYRGGENCWMTICAEESSLARTGMAIRHNAHMPEKNTEEWRQAIRKRIETHVLQKLQRHYQMAKVWSPQFTFEGQAGRFGNGGLNASEWMSVNFSIRKSPGMKNEHTAHTVRDLFRYQIPLSQVVYERQQTRSTTEFSALIHVPE